MPRPASRPAIDSEQIVTSLSQASLAELQTVRQNLSTLQESVKKEADLVEAAIQGDPLDLIRLAYYVHEGNELYMDSPNQIILLEGLVTQGVPEAKAHLADMIADLGNDEDRVIALATESKDCSLSRYLLGHSRLCQETRNSARLPTIEAYEAAFEDFLKGIEIGPSSFARDLKSIDVSIPDGAEFCADVLADEFLGLTTELQSAENSGNKDKFSRAATEQDGIEEYKKLAIRVFNLIEILKREHPQYAIYFEAFDTSGTNDYLAELTRQI